MIKIVMKPKGSGKTKGIIECANAALQNCNGDIVFITDNNHYMYDIKRDIRMINTADFNIQDFQVFYGFICGIIAEDYDISEIFIDNIMRIVKLPLEKLVNFISLIEAIGEKFNITFVMTVSDSEGICPDDLKPYLYQFE
ncbi:MAG: ATP-binding protein [Hyphomonadaceae bacterium]|nr:ATP-binding protein [Clostridia bacterium]